LNDLNPRKAGAPARFEHENI